MKKSDRFAFSIVFPILTENLCPAMGFSLEQVPQCDVPTLPQDVERLIWITHNPDLEMMKINNECRPTTTGSRVSPGNISKRFLVNTSHTVSNRKSHPRACCGTPDQ